MYGLHAVGLTEPVLHKLESVDARHLRSVARSPVHLTHESNTALRKRLKVASPMQALAASLEKRINTSDDNSFQEVLRNLRSLLLERISIGEEALPDHGGLLPCFATEGVACPDCGLYFDCMRTMKTHRSKKTWYI